ncbi:MAG: hypothetical protein KF773_21170 [Deltaproteobacteria bacterium]|nr:hypothetical protein [Deltaproteobacteria bacterium]
MLVALAVAALAGCGRDSIFFEIHVPDGMAGARVELFLGMHRCKLGDLGHRSDPDDCKGVRPPGLQGNIPVDGDVFFRDRADVTPFETFAGDDGVAYLEVGASPGTASPLAIATDPMDPQRVLAAAILGDVALYKGPLRVIVQLQPAGELDRTADGELGAQVWDTRDGTRRCAGAKVGGKRGRFVVPDDDHDCDGVPKEAECLELVHDAIVGTVVRDEPDCAAAQPDPRFGGACGLGGTICNEPAGLRKTCKTTDYCVPDRFCEKCKDGFGGGCLEDALEQATHLECTVAVEPGRDSTVPCIDSLIRGEIDVSNAGFLRPCVANMPAKLTQLGLPLQFGTSLQFVDASGQDTTDVTISVLPGQTTSCKVAVNITGTVAATSVGTDAVPAGIVRWEVAAEAGAPAMNVLLPVWLRFEAGCGNGAMTCKVLPLGNGLQDRVFKCAQ